MPRNIQTETTLTQSFATSNSVTLSLPYSLTDSFSATTTAFYNGLTYLNSNPNSAAMGNLLSADYVAGSVVGVGHLSGYKNPMHLKMNPHFEGAANTVYNGAGDALTWPYGSYSPTISISNNFTFAYGLTITQFTGGTVSSGTNNSAWANTAAAFGVTQNAGATITNSNSSATTAYLQYDLGVGNAKALSCFWIEYGSFGQATLTLSGSNDGSSYTTIFTSATNAASGTPYVITANSTAYRYYKFSWTWTTTSGFTNYVYPTMGFTFNPFVVYDTVNYQYGTSSIYLPGLTSSYLNANCSYPQVSNQDWQLRGCFRFSQAPNPMALFSSGVASGNAKQFEIYATSTGLQLNYYLDGSTVNTITSSNFSWSTNTWYYLSIRRTGNTLYFFINGTAYGTADLTGKSFFATNSTTGALGVDCATANPFNGNMDELEFWAGESNQSDSAPVAARSGAYFPACNWISTVSTFVPSTVNEIDVVLYQDTNYLVGTYPTAVIGTNVTVYLTIDGGASYHAVTLTKVGSLTVNASIYAGSLNTNGLTNTNQFGYKITVAQGYLFKLDGFITYWQDPSSNIFASTIPELSSIPGVGDTVANKLQALYQYFLLRRTVTASTETLLKSDGVTTLGSASLSDDGTTFTKGAAA